MFIIHMDSQAEKQLPVLEKNWERYSAPKFEQKATPGAGNLACYWALIFERKELLLIFEVSTGNMLNIDHLDIDPRDIMVPYITRDDAWLNQVKILYLKEKQQYLSQPFVTLSFCDWKMKKNLHKCPASPVVTLHERVPSFRI